jgi:dihydrofolate synthase / folylpolyglutamate synthase
MNFERALEYLDGFISYEKFLQIEYSAKNFDLDRLKKFLSVFGLDYSKIKFIHVGGSKGKGTVSCMISDYLVRKNKKVGLYTSPHVLSVKERISVDGKKISSADFCRHVQDLKDFFDENNRFQLTYFEILTVMALKHFVEEKVEYAVLEVGLGGRLDATNIVLPKVSVLTAVEKEHTAILGDTFEDILNEKLGIVKFGAPVVIGPQNEEVEGIIKNKLKGKKDVFFVEFPPKTGGLDDNKMIVLKVLHVLLGELDKKILEKVFAEFKMLGHCDVRFIDEKPIVFDVAHTPKSTEFLLRFLKDRFVGKKFVFLISVLRDKKVKEIICKIQKEADFIVFTSVDSVRAHSFESFSEEILDENISFSEDPFKAFELIFAQTKRDQVIVVTGSHLLVGKILSSLSFE